MPTFGKLRRSLPLIGLAILASLASVSRAGPTPPAAISWQPWSDDVFARATREHKFVLMDLEAVWCHWCHVMDATTYRDPRVVALINQKYIAVKVDQDSRPDIANRYEDWGWPATVIFNADRGEIAKRRGYVEPAAMASLLQAVIDDPTPGPSVAAEVEVHPSGSASLAPDARENLQHNLFALYDDRAGGWGGATKFVDADVVEYCLRLASLGDRRAEQMVRQTLTANLRLIDPAWGGVYQYSTDGDWVHPHFEKIMSYQADDLRTYAMAYATARANTPTPGSEVLPRPGSPSPAPNESGWSGVPSEPGVGREEASSYLSAAQSIHHYLTTFLLSPDGAFYTSQDADLNPGEHSAAYFALDDAARRKLGLPRVDTHVYARENGWAIAALATYSNVTGDEQALAQATRAAEWVLAHRAIDGGGGFRHDECDPAGPYLGDTLAMGRAFLALYGATADRVWLNRADAAARFIEAHFVSADAAGVQTAVSSSGLPPRPQLDENVNAARFARLLYAYTGDAAHEELAGRAMRYLAAPEVTSSRRWLVGGILLADEELSGEPLHVTIVGDKSDPLARQLFTTARATPRAYFRLEWYDPHEGPLSQMEVQFPKLPTAAAFVCTGTTCSLPARDVEGLKQKLGRALGR